MAGAGLAAPPATADPTAHADWLELRALRAADQSSAIEDLIGELRRSGSVEEIEADSTDPEPDRGSTLAETVTEAAFSEIDDRAKACGGTYPFAVDSLAITATPSARTSIYTFLLLLRLFGAGAGPTGVKAERLFEDVAVSAAADYLGTGQGTVQSYLFGFPRRVAPAGFRTALNELCTQLGEGAGAKASPTTVHAKDGTLDLVVWRPFADGRPGFLAVFGQCATGENWTEKVSVMQPENFAAKWMHERPSVVPLRAFFLPHRVPADRWYDVAVDAGILFDRCRIAAHSEALPTAVAHECGTYSRYVLTEARR